MNSKNNSSFGVGIITIFTVLIVLCLSVFAMLTLTTANADLKLAEINASSVSAYYSADIEAQRLYASFAEGSESELQEDIYMTENQSLRLHLVRENDSVTILSWKTVIVADFEIDNTLDLWDGMQFG